MKKYWIPIVAFFLGATVAFGAMRLTSLQRPAAIIINPPVPTQTPQPISVYINGAVNQPGVYQLPHDSRLESLLDEAGGVTDDAAEDGINLAAILVDGAQIFIANEGDGSDREEMTAQLASPERTTIRTGTMANSGTSDTSLININTADRAQLEQIPGVGEATARKILVYREDNGLFTSIEQIMNVSGIGEAKFDAMRDIITIGTP